MADLEAKKIPRSRGRVAAAIAFSDSEGDIECEFEEGDGAGYCDMTFAPHTMILLSLSDDDYMYDDGQSPRTCATRDHSIPHISLARH